MAGTAVQVNKYTLRNTKARQVKRNNYVVCSLPTASEPSRRNLPPKNRRRSHSARLQKLPNASNMNVPIPSQLGVGPFRKTSKKRSHRTTTRRTENFTKNRRQTSYRSSRTTRRSRPTSVVVRCAYDEACTFPAIPRRSIIKKPGSMRVTERHVSWREPIAVPAPRELMAEPATPYITPALPVVAADQTRNFGWCCAEDFKTSDSE